MANEKVVRVFDVSKLGLAAGTKRIRSVTAEIPEVYVTQDKQHIVATLEIRGFGQTRFFIEAMDFLQKKGMYDNNACRVRKTILRRALLRSVKVFVSDGRVSVLMVINSKHGNIISSSVPIYLN